MTNRCIGPTGRSIMIWFVWTPGARPADEWLHGRVHMALHPAAEATLRAFVVPAKRDRWLTRFGSAKRRKEARDALNHFADWDPHYVEAFSSSTEILAALCRAGGPAECHVISDDPALDGRDLPLAEAVDAAEAHPFASVLCCSRGQLACFFGEIAAPRERILLRRSRRP